MKDHLSLAAASSGPFDHKLSTTTAGGVDMLYHRESGVMFLPQGHGFRAGQVYRYDHRGRNVSVRYTAGSSAIVSIYVLPFDPPRTGEEFTAIFDASVVDMLSGVHTVRSLDDRRTAFARAAGGVVPGRRCRAVGVLRPEMHRLDVSFVELYALPAWLLKIRATCQPSAYADLEGFLGAWLAAALPPQL